MWRYTQVFWMLLFLWQLTNKESTLFVPLLIFLFTTAVCCFHKHSPSQHLATRWYRILFKSKNDVHLSVPCQIHKADNASKSSSFATLTKLKKFSCNLGCRSYQFNDRILNNLGFTWCKTYKIFSFFIFIFLKKIYFTSTEVIVSRIQSQLCPHPPPSPPSCPLPHPYF